MQAHQNESSPQKHFRLIALWFYIFLLWQFNILIECFSSNQLDEIKHVLFFKTWIQQKCFKFYCSYYETYLIQP